MNEAIQVKLFSFSLPDKEPDLYLFSLKSDETWLRKQFYHQDQGGLERKIYELTYKEGIIKRITSLKQIDPTDYDTIPYNSSELNNWEFDLTIQDFFNPEVLKDYL